MDLSRTVGSMALVLAVLMAVGHARGEDSNQAPALKETAQKKVDAREAQRRAAVADQQRRKEDFARRCNKPVKTDSELEACRVAYRRL